MKSIRGDLSLMSLPDLLQWAEANKRTGTLILIQQETSKIFILQNGEMQLETEGIEAEFTDALKWKEGEFEFTEALSAAPPDLPVKQDAPSNPVSDGPYKKIIKEIADRIKEADIELPPVPDMIIKLNQYMQREDASVQHIVKIVMADQILTSKILKVVNSSFYRPPSPITSLHHAISYMGFRSVISVVTAHALTSMNSKNSKEIKGILSHCLLCAFISKRIASYIRQDPEEVFLCGLLHDIGKTVLTNLISNYKLPDDIRKHLIQEYHVGAGYALAAKWNLSDAVKMTARYHHHPEKAQSHKDIVETVFLANIFANDPKNLEALPVDSCKAIDIKRIGIEEILRELDMMKETVASII